jgi:hypothetical protein
MDVMSRTHTSQPVHSAAVCPGRLFQMSDSDSVGAAVVASVQIEGSA